MARYYMQITDTAGTIVYSREIESEEPDFDDIESGDEDITNIIELRRDYCNSYFMNKIAERIEQHEKTNA